MMDLTACRDDDDDDNDSHDFVEAVVGRRDASRRPPQVSSWSVLTQRDEDDEFCGIEAETRWRRFLADENEDDTKEDSSHATKSRTTTTTTTEVHGWAARLGLGDSGGGGGGGGGPGMGATAPLSQAQSELSEIEWRALRGHGLRSPLRTVPECPEDEEPSRDEADQESKTSRSSFDLDDDGACKGHAAPHRDSCVIFGSEGAVAEEAGAEDAAEGVVAALSRRRQMRAFVVLCGLRRWMRDSLLRLGVQGITTALAWDECHSEILRCFLTTRNAAVPWPSAAASASASVAGLRAVIDEIVRRKITLERLHGTDNALTRAGEATARAWTHACHTVFEERTHDDRPPQPRRRCALSRRRRCEPPAASSQWRPHEPPKSSSTAADAADLWSSHAARLAFLRALGHLVYSLALRFWFAPALVPYRVWSADSGADEPVPDERLAAVLRILPPRLARTLPTLPSLPSSSCRHQHEHGREHGREHEPPSLSLSPLSPQSSAPSGPSAPLSAPRATAWTRQIRNQILRLLSRLTLSASPDRAVTWADAADARPLADSWADWHRTLSLFLTDHFILHVASSSDAAETSSGHDLGGDALGLVEPVEPWACFDDPRFAACPTVSSLDRLWDAPDEDND